MFNLSEVAVFYWLEFHLVCNDHLLCLDLNPISWSASSRSLLISMVILQLYKLNLKTCLTLICWHNLVLCKCGWLDFADDWIHQAYINQGKQISECLEGFGSIIDHPSNKTNLDLFVIHCVYPQPHLCNCATSLFQHSACHCHWQ